MEIYILELQKEIDFKGLISEFMKATFYASIDVDNKIRFNPSEGEFGELSFFQKNVLSDIDKDEINSLINSHSKGLSIANDSLMSNYERYTEDGKKFYNQMRTNYILKVSSGLMTIEEASHLDATTRDVTKDVGSGSWHSGHGLALELTPDTIFTQEIKDKLVLDLKTYINNNYPIELHV